ncbi:type VII secretion target [Actinoplanes sp. M2I2]|uniref:type VII secretion target n=1 Tax=Actinoplanes sp. M2I2 TaxID=1734444 RepID=UPI00202285D7|nr:type VII secretion target [Actinoplanes sp. M2I2]
MGIEVPPEEVRRHARDVDEAGRMLDEARAAAAHVRVSSNAYGYFVGALIANFYMNPHADEAIAAYQKTVDGMNGLADQVRAMADDYDHSDERAADRVRGTR